MNSDHKTRTNRDQEQIENAKAGVSPTTQAGAEQSAAASRDHDEEDSGPMTDATNREERRAAPAPLKQTGDKLATPDSGDGQNPTPDT